MDENNLNEDEPTTGMDPKKLEDFMEFYRHCEGRKISYPYSHRYGNGYTLTLRVANAPSKMEDVRRFIESTFGSSACLQEQHLNQMEYQLAPSLSLAFVFQELEQARDRLSIEDYSVSQTTLDQVFISFAKMQADVTEGVPTESIAHQIVRNKRGKRIKGGSENGAAMMGDIELLVQHSYASGANQSPAHML
ncbi:phospholipid-transporting ATPase ABCA1 [Caerostris extrusa]|uniref:Phospholipid-transporting ATPase ABCA1 n=1 Tax=Caerostris extrusa TaxID=172846 RepID=A0AAV4RY51_CAEEX|nr:phospholipid-transporting ATPase ABCA1 [Caerostris extrusa]